MSPSSGKGTLWCVLCGEAFRQGHEAGICDGCTQEYWRWNEALNRIAAPKRPDGTYNLSREACEQIAAKALEEQT